MVIDKKISNVAILFKLTFKLSVLPVKIQLHFCRNYRNLQSEIILKNQMRMKGPRIAGTILENNSHCS